MCMFTSLVFHQNIVTGNSLSNRARVVAHIRFITLVLFDSLKFCISFLIVRSRTLWFHHLFVYYYNYEFCISIFAAD